MTQALKTDAQQLVLLRLASIADEADISWSLSRNGIIEERALLSFAARPNNVEHLAKDALTLGMQPTAVAQWQQICVGADAVGLGLTAGLTSLRLYAHFWKEQVRRIENGNLRPFPVYRGVKSLPDGSLRDDVYMSHPMARRKHFIPLLMTSVEEFGLDEAAASRAFAGLLSTNTVVTRTDGHGRMSWLVTLRKAGVPRHEISTLLAPLPTTAATERLRAAAQDSDLVHVAGGADPLKGHFLTFYFSAEPEHALDALHRARLAP